MLFKTAILSIAFFSLIACDNDFNEVGADMVDSGNFEALRYDRVALSSQDKKINKVQSNILSSYALGVYQDGDFGNTKAHIVTQLALSQSGPSFGEDPVLDSVVLHIPYFSTVESQEGDSRVYQLDSVYGEDPIQLSVYRSGYFLRNYDPTDDYNTQAYFSDEFEKFEENLIGEPLVVENAYLPSKKEIVLKDLSGAEDAKPERLSPALRLKLPVKVFRDLILKKEGSEDLSNNDSFQNYFRGLYIKVHSPSDRGTYSLLNLRSEQAGITLYYHNETKDSDGESVKRYQSFKLNIGNQILNLLETESDTDPSEGADRLFVKGGAGSLAYIDLFRDPEQLDSLRHTDWLINEANLKLYVDQSKLPGNYDLPERIFVFDVKNKRVLKDYANATDIMDNDILNSRTVHLGRLKKEENGQMFYKIRLTGYIDDILKKDSTNTRLGVVVAQNVNEESFVKALTEDGEAIRIPRSEVVARNGVLFFNEKESGEEALKLEIFYTAPRIKQ